MLQEAKEKVFHFERQIETLKAQLTPLESALVNARQDLAVHEAMDRNRW